MKKSYRLAPIGMMLGAVFVIVSIGMGLNPRMVGTTGPEMVFIVGWCGFLGSAIIYASFVRRVELTDEGITKFSSLGKVERRFAWSEVSELAFDRVVKSRNSNYNQYALKSKSGEIMTLPDNFGGWDDVRDTINRRLQNPSNSGEPLVTNTETVPSSSQAKAKKSTIAAGIFVGVWLTLFILFGSLAGTSCKYDVVMHNRGDSWDVEYTFTNTSKFNSITFDIERTFLDGTEAETVPNGVRVNHGESCVMHVMFPKSAVKGTVAHLHSWWQYHNGNSNFHMQAMDKYFSLEPDPPKISMPDANSPGSPSKS